jgi:hypothetical protein
MLNHLPTKSVTYISKCTYSDGPFPAILETLGTCPRLEV